MSEVNDAVFSMVERIYSVPLYSSEMGPENQMQKELESKMDQIQFFDVPKFFNKSHKITKSEDGYFDEDIIAKYDMKTVAEYIDVHLKNYCEQSAINYIEDYDRTSWITLFEKNDFGHTHNHTNADISGCYYISTNGEDGDIYFKSPVQAATSSLAWGAIGTSMSHSPKVGKLLMFPGWLDHGINKNNTDSKRMSLSFNIYFNYKRKIK